MKLGLLVEVEEGLTWQRWRALFGAAEALGFDSIWASDHLVSPWSVERHGLDCWVALSVAAAETRRVQLGSLVSPVTFRPPAVLVRMAESVQGLSGGRLTVGLGLGWNSNEHVAHGLAFPPIQERARLLSETATRVKGVAPLLIGGSGERWTLPLVARCADEWNVTTTSVELLAARSRVLAGLCADSGRSPDQIRRSVAAGYLLGRDAAELRERSRRIQAWVPPLADVDVDAVPEAARRMGWVVGTPAEITMQLRRLANAGIERVMLGHYDQDDREALELVARDVMPRVL
jgi:alkanesulfonate monooxygenase SsuD/methylene tetrahydromethanopterin reductase-like flavin-dependent oxidoreductase (luciferase family)